MAMQQRKRRRRSGGNNNNNNNNNSNNPNKHFESNGPEVRIRGSAAQILEKYQQYANDAHTSGDRVKAEALFQHAEHYARIVAVNAKEQETIRLEREARDAVKAEERAVRDAEERAERMAKAEERAAAAAAAGEDASSADAGQDDAETSTDEDEAPKRRRRSRKPREDTAEGEVKADAPEADTDSEPEAPKRRRRTYKPKDDAAEEDGVMKTLSRGAEPAAIDSE